MGNIRARKAMGMGIFDAPFYYFLRDEFTATLAAGAVNNTLATDGINTRVVVDTENKLSIASNRLVYAGGKASPALGDPRLRYSAAFVRREGMTLDAAVRMNTTNQGTFGLHNGTGASFNIKNGFRFGADGKFHDSLTNTDLGTFIWSNADKLCRVVIHTVGSDLYTSDNGGLSWTLEIQDATDTGNPLYLNLDSYNLTGGFNWIELTNRAKNRAYGYFYDDFTRADTTAAGATNFTVCSLGQNSQGFVWTNSGANAPFISSNHFAIGDIAEAGYGFLSFPSTVTPHTLKATVQWDAAGGGGGNDTSVAVLIAGTTLLTDMVHCIFRRDKFTLTVWDNADGGDHITLAEQAFTECALDTQYTIEMRVSGNTVTIIDPTGTERSYTNAAVSTHWGRNLAYELVLYADWSAKPKFKDATVLW